MLSAAELITQGSTNATALPEFGAQKLFGPDESGREEETYEHAINQYNKILHEQRICCRATLSIGHWDCERNVAVVTAKKGGNFQKFGYQSRNGWFLNPEETLFLVDQGLLELTYNGLPISLHEAYILIVPLLPSFEYYEVYAYLCRLGYVVTRYIKRNIGDDTGGSKWGNAPPSPINEDNVEEKEEESLEPMASGYLKNLWSGNPGEIPCIRPSEATNTAAVLSKLQVMKLLKLKNITVSDKAEPLQRKIHFDVYLSRKLRKDLGAPRFRIVVCKYSDPPPSLYEMGCLTNESNGVNIKLAIVSDGAVSFYGMFGVDTPTILTVG